MATLHPTFHDGLVTGLRLAGDGGVIYLTHLGGAEWRLVLAGVQALQMDDFRQGNIISAVWVINGTRPDPALLERLYPGPHPSAAAEYHQAHAALMSAKAAMVERGEAVLLVIEPSYGADLVAFCAGIGFECETAQEG